MLRISLLQRFDEAGAAFGRSVAAVHEAVDADVGHALALGHFEQRVEVRVHGMHAAVAQQAHQVQAAGRGHDAWRAGAVGSLKKSPVTIMRSMRVTSMWMTRPAPMFRCPTSLLPIWPSGKPTNGPEV